MKTATDYFRNPRKTSEAQESSEPELPVFAGCGIFAFIVWALSTIICWLIQIGAHDRWPLTYPDADKTLWGMILSQWEFIKEAFEHIW